MRLGVATHRYADGSELKIDLELRSRGSKGFPATLLERDGDPWHAIGIGGATQARRLSELLAKAADRLEARGQL